MEKIVAVLEKINAALEKQDETLGHIYDQLLEMNLHLDDISGATADGLHEIAVAIGQIPMSQADYDMRNNRKY